ncbi:MAG: recombinase family protein, partial [Candidatus Sumerlaeia bacterium]|nr:recombinase family protein [Candidatus Sumerlaeia bacterium]
MTPRAPAAPDARNGSRASANRSAEPPANSPVRCAIYTRKSTEEGLDQDFNSLDAQREAAETFIASQRHEGWVAVAERYDDGGFTGANMDRPALGRLLADIEAGRVDTVIVYKVDRLSRSLMDFSRIIGLFDQHGVAFVSVTQQFNTSSSMGRLTLNILLSFAQFEREMISERTRDKMGAARRKGKYVGGLQVLGYDVDDQAKRFVVNEPEAAIVRELFAMYLRERRIIAVCTEANRRGWTTKSWVRRDGTRRPGQPFNKSRLYALLTNVLYTGKVRFRGELYAGEHAAIVDDATFARVEELLRHNGANGGTLVRNTHGVLLKGLLRCKGCGAAMVHSFTRRGDRMFRYYVCGPAQRSGYASCATRGVSAAEIERFVVERIREIGADPTLQDEALRQLLASTRERRPQLDAERIRLQTE